jgi:hypothetical protein
LHDGSQCGFAGVGEMGKAFYEVEEAGHYMNLVQK